MIDKAELVSVADDEVVLCYPAILGEPAVPLVVGVGASREVVEPPEIIEPARIVRFHSLLPGSEMNIDGLTIHTLPRPSGERLSTIATVNDLHFGETVCGELGTIPVSPMLRDPDGALPHADLMNRAVVADISLIDEHTGFAADLVIAKGDLTDNGTATQFDSFMNLYGTAFDSRLRWMRGNHDRKNGSVITGPRVDSVDLDGVTLALLDTSVDDSDSGTLLPDQIEWLDELASRADRPVLVFGHHHPAAPGAHAPGDYYFGIDPEASSALVEVIARRTAIAGYFAGHTHRNRTRYFAETGPVPYVEVACVKDFPGSWAEYRVFEGGILQVHRRATGAEALAWSEATRVLYGGLYPEYALGSPSDRCFSIEFRTGADRRRQA